MIKFVSLYAKLFILTSVSLFLFSCGASNGAVKTTPVAPAVVEKKVGDSSTSYRLKPGDTVKIVVFGEPELTMDVELNEGGSVPYPYLGELSLLGKTLSEVQQTIYKGLSDGYLVNPKVSVTMDTFREIFVGGEVVQGGNFAFQPGLTVSKAIVLARGFTERAARNRIYVVSEDQQGGKPARVSMDYILKPGDVVTVQRRFF